MSTYWQRGPGRKTTAEKACFVVFWHRISHAFPGGPGFWVQNCFVLRGRLFACACGLGFGVRGCVQNWYEFYARCVSSCVQNWVIVHGFKQKKTANERWFTIMEIYGTGGWRSSSFRNISAIWSKVTKKFHAEARRRRVFCFLISLCVSVSLRESFLFFTAKRLFTSGGWRSLSCQRSNAKLFQRLAFSILLSAELMLQRLMVNR